MSAPIDGICRVAVVNLSAKLIQLGGDTLIATINSVEQTSNGSQIAATTSRLSYQEKLRKVLSELKVDTFDDSVPHKQQLILLISNYLGIFSENDSDVGYTNLTCYNIDTSKVCLLRQPVRQLLYGEMRAAVESEINKLFNAEIARPSMSPWASPVVMVRKKDGGFRMCVDYRRLNFVTKFDCFPLPRFNKALDAFVGATMFSSPDLAIAYYQVSVKLFDIEKIRCYYSRWSLRNGDNTVWTVQCTVDLSTANIRCSTKPKRSHLFGLS